LLSAAALMGAFQAEMSMIWPTFGDTAAFCGRSSCSAGGGAAVASLAEAGWGSGFWGGGLVVNDDKATLETLMVFLSVRPPFPRRLCA
jgi:hypothetical protein